MSLINMVNCNFMPSLEYTALVKIASTLWNPDEIRDLLGNFVCPPLSILVTRSKQRLKDRVTERISRLSLPESLKEKLVDLVKPMCLAISNWLQYHLKYFPAAFVEANLDKLCWSQQGTVDRKATAEVLVKDENTDITIRYKLACVYCLHNDIPLLWDKMPNHLRKTFCGKTYLTDLTAVEQKSFEIIWAHDLKGELNKLTHHMGKLFGRRISPYRYGFKMAITTANKVAAEYFFQRLTPEEQSKSIAVFVRDMNAINITLKDLNLDVPKEYFSDLLCFILSRMTEEQQTKLFQRHFYKVVMCFLVWPFQNSFTKLANFVWSTMSVDYVQTYQYLLCGPVLRVYIDGLEGVDCKIIFREFWLQSPNSYKKYLLSKPNLTSELLFDLFRVGDKNYIHLILKEANSQEKEDIIHCDYGMALCKMLVRENKGDLLDFFIEECISSKSSGDKLKKTLKGPV